MWAFLATAAHLRPSAAMKAAKSSGDPGIEIAPSFSMLACMSGERNLKPGQTLVAFVKTRSSG